MLMMRSMTKSTLNAFFQPLSWSVVAFFLIFSNSSPAAEATFNSGHNEPSTNILFLNDIKWPPFFFPKLEKGKAGFGKEILNRCLATLNYQQQFKTLPIKRTHLYMSTGELDISVYSYKKSREAFVIYGKEPIFITEYGFASKKSDNLTINQLSDVTRYTIGHLAGLAHTPELTQIIEQKKRRNEVSIGHDIDSMFGQMLAQPQRFQVMANSKETLLWRSTQLGLAEQVTVHELTIKSKPYFVTVSRESKNIPNHEQFLAQMDGCIMMLKSAGEYQTIANGYGLNYTNN